MRKLLLGTRGSELATTQSGHVADALRAATGVEVELVIIKTRGDMVRDRPLAQVGGKGLFTKEIEDAMLAGSVDFAVHSLKDMPTDDPPGLVIHAIPEREDPRDALVGAVLDELPEGAVIGTGSARRAVQVRALRPDLRIEGIRGNVGTRIRKQREGAYDAVLLAVSGLRRLGRQDVITEALAADRMVPAVGQGALAVQCRSDDREVQELLDAIHHERTARCVAVERSFLQAVGGGCSAPAACHAVWDGDAIYATAVLADDEQGPLRRASRSSDPVHVAALGRELAKAVAS